jgi:hypothetical protein
MASDECIAGVKLSGSKPCPVCRSGEGDECGGVECPSCRGGKIGHDRTCRYCDGCGVVCKEAAEDWPQTLAS